MYQSVLIAAAFKVSLHRGKHQTAATLCCLMWICLSIYTFTYYFIISNYYSSFIAQLGHYIDFFFQSRYRQVILSVNFISGQYKLILF